MNIDKIKEALKSILVEMGSVKTVDGNEISYEGESLEVGVTVNVEDGEYVLEDGSVLVVKEGKVESITPKEETEETVEETETEMEETEPTEEPTSEPTEEPVEETENDFDIKAEFEKIWAEIDSLKEKLNELMSVPAVEPIAEEFEKVDTKRVKGNNTANILSFVHK